MAVDALRFSGVKVNRSGRLVLDLPDFCVKSGEMLCVEGGNGAGKSTLLLAAAGLLDLAEGSIRMFDADYVTGQAPAPSSLRRRTALVLQDPWLPPGTVRHALDFAMRMRGIGTAERQTRGRQTVMDLGLQELDSRDCSTLSGGERKFVAFAMAWVLSPDILLLDEVMSGLDESRCSQLEGSLLKQATDQGKTVLLSTHDPRLAGRLGARQIELRDGKMNASMCD